ncbi:alpha-(1,3)-fucosyltransferase C-like [Argiope bruennichi]|uniref:Fucosyltransferase n=1 Tax=Argiope bruennichi TaxID=94029 RepID=A0A8T0F9N0_ARGBR|nr:alpha-(1,3)-fucosyltransferase C-like [Argiope bruennichi]XP_055941109.1 alpha-(1,3)-fucosyltransferase C-like [Argiope bruennichi]KAF8787092.1 Fucosyltransferase C like protein [Argiope bruennichi]
MDKFPILKRLCKRLYLLSTIIVAAIIFTLYLKSENYLHINDVYIQHDNAIPTIDPYLYKARNRISEASANSNTSLEIKERHQINTSKNVFPNTSEMTLLIVNSSITNSSYYHETNHNNTKYIRSSIDLNNSTYLPSRDINGTHTTSPMAKPVPETCQKFSMKGAKLILLWTPFFGGWDYFPQGNFQFCSHCRNCRITTDRSELRKSDGIIFHARDILLFDLPPVRYPHQRWIFYSLESPPYSDYPGLEHMRNMFNWTMTYRTDSDIVSRYGAIVRNTQPKQIDLQSLQKYFEKKSRSVVWMTSHCPTYGGRDEYVAKLRKYIEVDVYGTCGTSVCPPGDTEKCLQEYADKYKFFLAFENTICKDYITEKLFRNLNYDIIPVVFGGADYDKFVPPNSYIDALSFQSPKHLALFLSGVGNDFELYSNYFKWRENYSIGIINRKECDLCTNLHRKDLKPSSYSDLRKWWVTDSQCRAWKPK